MNCVFGIWWNQKGTCPNRVLFAMLLRTSFPLLPFLAAVSSYTWGTDFEHGFHGVYLGDLERLQDIQKKRDVTNRDWQRIILTNIAKSLYFDQTKSSAKKGEVNSNSKTDDKEDATLITPSEKRSIVFETRQLWWQVHTKMQHPDYGNMLLLDRMKDELEGRMYQRKQKYLTFSNFEQLVNKVHLDAEGHVVDPFVEISDRKDRAERQQSYYESLTQDLEEECLIK
jgi:hypothetical protein